MANTQSADSVAVKSLAWNRMELDWDLIRDLLGGTRVMREMGEKWLPKEPKEKITGYRIRVARSFLYGGYKDTVDALVSKPFSKPVVLNEPDSLPDKLKILQTDTDRKGSDLTQFARRVYRWAINDGAALIVVDHPKGEAGEVPNLKEEKAEDIRPYFTLVRLQDVWGFKEGTTADGKRVITRIQLHETVKEDEGEFGDAEVDQVRVWYAPGEPVIGEDVSGDEEKKIRDTSAEGHWQIWREGRGAWTRHDGGTHTYPGIPMTVFYTNEVEGSTLEARPPLMDLAWKNLEHWQSSSDQRNILRFIRFAMLYATGLSDDEVRKEIVVGPKQVLKSTSKDAKFGFVEHTGKGVDSGRQDLQDIQAQMEVLGLQPLVERSGNTTATGKVLDEGKKFSMAQVWVRGEENALLEAYQIAGRWTNGPTYELPEKFTVDIHNEFALSAQAGRDLDWLLKAREKNQIDHRTFLEEARRRGPIHELSDIDAIIAAVKAEQEEMAAMFGPPPELVEDEDDEDDDEGDEDE